MSIDLGSDVAVLVNTFDPSSNYVHVDINEYVPACELSSCGYSSSSI